MRRKSKGHKHACQGRAICIENTGHEGLAPGACTWPRVGAVVKRRGCSSMRRDLPTRSVWMAFCPVFLHPENGKGGRQRWQRQAQTAPSGWPLLQQSHKHDQSFAQDRNRQGGTGKYTSQRIFPGRPRRCTEENIWVRNNSKLTIPVW